MPETLSELDIPVKVEGKVVAIINIESDELDAFNKEDNKLAETLAHHVGTAISNILKKEELHIRNKELERSNRELDDYTHVVSHDLKAPLRSITAFSNFLREDYMEKLDETGREYLRRIKDASNRMDRFIADLLVLSRVGRKYLETKSVDLNKMMEDVKQDLESQFAPAEIIVDELPMIKTQKVWVRQLFGNLIGNGLKFNKSPTPRVEVGCEESRDDYLFSVMDNGIGIKEEYQKQLFKLFQRLHTENEYPGTGAGLAICKKIVESFGGEIWVESQHGSGSTFFFTFPKERDGDLKVSERPLDVDQGLLQVQGEPPLSVV